MLLTFLNDLLINLFLFITKPIHNDKLQSLVFFKEYNLLISSSNESFKKKHLFPCECSTFNKRNLYSTLEKCASCSGIGGLYYADTSKTIKISLEDDMNLSSLH